MDNGARITDKLPHNSSPNNAVFYLPLSTNSAGGKSKLCKETASGAKLNHLVSLSAFYAFIDSLSQLQLHSYKEIHWYIIFEY